MPDNTSIEEINTVAENQSPEANKDDANNQDSYNIKRSDEQLKKTWAGEKAKLSQMSASEKAEYIFAYYKLPIIGAILVIGIIVYLIYHQLTYVRYELYGIEVNSDVYNEAAVDQMHDYLQMDKHTGVSYIAGLVGDKDSTVGGMYDQITIYTVAGNVDFVFADETGADYVCKMGAVSDVNVALPAELLELWKDRVTDFSVWDASTDDTFFNAPVAIDISGTNVQKYFGLDDKTKYLLICDLSGNEEYMQGFYNMLYDIETGTLEAE